MNGNSVLLVLLMWIIHPSLAFMVPSIALLSSSSSSSYSAKHQRSRWRLAAASSANLVPEEDTNMPSAQTLLSSQQELFPTAKSFLDLEIKLHRPLGCTVEESLADHSVTHVVFVSKVVQGGFAETAGLQVGDVLMGVTGIFGEMESVTGLGVDKVKGLVASVPDTEPLTMSVARGTTVMAQHEQALVELCASPGVSDKQVEECVVEYIAEGYNYQPEEVDNDEECDADDADTECMLDGMHLMWADDLPATTTNTNMTDSAASELKSAPKVKPWSSRSSGSGTYVRDPKTGEMRNIDLDPPDQPTLPEGTTTTGEGMTTEW